MDVTPGLAPASDCQTVQDFVHGPRVCTITGVRLYKNEKGQDRIEVRLDSETRPWRSSLGMGDLMTALWGTESDAWLGQKAELYNDPDVTMGKERTGGIRISAATGISEPTTFTVRDTGRHKKKQVTVRPLGDGA